MNSPIPLFPGSRLSNRSTKRNSVPWGSLASAAARVARGLSSLFERFNDFVIGRNFWRESLLLDLWIHDRINEIVAHGRAIGKFELVRLKSEILRVKGECNLRHHPAGGGRFWFESKFTGMVGDGLRNNLQA